jgi:hypothetical protein
MRRSTSTSADFGRSPIAIRGACGTTAIAVVGQVYGSWLRPSTERRPPRGSAAPVRVGSLSPNPPMSKRRRGASA